MTKCVFCGREENDFIGVHLVKNDGTVNFYCSSKCRKNSLKLGRDRRNLKWTEAFYVTREKAAKREASKIEKDATAAKAKVESDKVKAAKKAAKKK